MTPLLTKHQKTTLSLSKAVRLGHHNKFNTLNIEITKKDYETKFKMEITTNKIQPKNSN